LHTDWTCAIRGASRCSPRDTYEVVKLGDLSAVSLMIQGERDLYWAVKDRDLKVPDPPVYWYWLDYEQQAQQRFLEIEESPFAAHVPTFVLRHMSYLLFGYGGGFKTDIPTPAEVRQQLREAFPIQSRFDNFEIFEARNILVLLGPSSAGDHLSLNVNIWKRTSRQHVPSFLWKYAPK
jgi:hypothetical protein